MDRRTFVKAVALEARRCLMQGLDPMVRAESAPVAVPPIELHGLADYKPSPLGMPGLSRASHRDPRPQAIVRNRVSQPIVQPYAGAGA